MDQTSVKSATAQHTNMGLYVLIQFTPEGVRVREPYAYRNMSDGEKVRKAVESSPGIQSYPDFRSKLIDAAIDINVRVRRKMGPESCDLSLP